MAQLAPNWRSVFRMMGSAWVQRARITPDIDAIVDKIKVLD